MSRGPYASEETSAATIGYLILSLIAGSLLLPLLPAVFGERPRHLAFTYAAAYLSGIVIVLMVAYVSLRPRHASLETGVELFAYLAAMASSTLAIFWIGRELGYRFLRARRRGLFERWSMPRPVGRVIAKAKQLNRASSVWVAIACATIAAVCILFWLVSLSTAKAQLGFAFGVENEITVARGTVTISVIVSSRSAR
jgi:hypothetical protein